MQRTNKQTDKRNISVDPNPNLDLSTQNHHLHDIPRLVSISSLDTFGLFVLSYQYALDISVKKMHLLTL